MGDGGESVDTRGLPDFIIIGAAKCGTTSLHHILAQHERIFIPDYEVYFFDVDDIEQHPDFFRQGDAWVWHDFDADRERYLAWYRRVFEGARPGQLIGEDTTTYVASGLAAERIARMLPEVKLIVMLRDPVARAYSHYWHNVRKGRSTRSFEETIRYAPGNLLERGRYRRQLERYRSFIDDGRLLTVFFEDMVADTPGQVVRVCEYLGVPMLDLDAVETHQNVSPVPFSVPLRLAFNRVMGRQLEGRRKIPNMPGYELPPADQALDRGPGPGAGLEKRWNQAVRAALPGRRLPPMADDTRSFLERLYARDNAGLGELIGEDVARRWPYMGP
ncbi:MAG: sulfotransferase [Myxococcales bacterium]|nr:sulfotransferase [Myxococcales bacterium]